MEEASNSPVETSALALSKGQLSEALRACVDRLSLADLDTFHQFASERLTTLIQSCSEERSQVISLKDSDRWGYRLPSELLEYIFLCLEAPFLILHAGSVCKHWFQISRSQDLWRKLFETHWSQVAHQGVVDCPHVNWLGEYLVRLQAAYVASQELPRSSKHPPEYLLPLERAKARPLLLSMNGSHIAVALSTGEVEVYELPRGHSGCIHSPAIPAVTSPSPSSPQRAGSRWSEYSVPKPAAGDSMLVHRQALTAPTTCLHICNNVCIVGNNAGGVQFIQFKQPANSNSVDVADPVSQVWVEHYDAVTALAVNEISSLALSVSKDGTGCLWDVRERKPIYQHAMNPGNASFAHHDSSILACAFQSSLAVTGGEDAVIHVYHISSPATRTSSQDMPLTVSYSGILEGHDAPVSAVDVTPSLGMCASGSDNFQIRIWSVESFACLARIDHPSGAILDVKITPACLTAVADNCTVLVSPRRRSGNYVHLGTENVGDNVLPPAQDPYLCQGWFVHAVKAPRAFIAPPLLADGAGRIVRALAPVNERQPFELLITDYEHAARHSFGSTGAICIRPECVCPGQTKTMGHGDVESSQHPCTRPPRSVCVASSDPGTTTNDAPMSPLAKLCSRQAMT